MINSGGALDTRTRVKSWIALGIVYLVWGSTYLAIRVGVEHLPPLLLAGTRYVIAGALLYPIARRASAATPATANGAARPGAKAWLACAVVGLLLLFAGNGGVSVAETRLPSGVAALLVATVPLWMIVFAWPVEHQRVTVRAAAGLAIGLVGVAVLVGAGLSGGGMSGVFIVLGASAAWGLGSVLSHRLPVLFSDANRYDPDRYVANPKQTSYLHGFGGGTHRCLGEHFADLLTHVTVTRLLQNYELTLITARPLPVPTPAFKGPRSPCLIGYSAKPPVNHR